MAANHATNNSYKNGSFCIINYFDISSTVIDTHKYKISRNSELRKTVETGEWTILLSYKSQVIVSGKSLHERHHSTLIPTDIGEWIGI